MARKSDAIMKSIEDLKRHRLAHIQQRKNILNNEDLSDKGKEKLLAQLAQQEPEIRAAAKSAYQAAKASRDALNKQAADVHAAYESSRDYGALSARMARYKVLFAEPSNPFVRETQTDRIAHAYRQAQQLGDIDAQRAIRLAALDVLDPLGRANDSEGSQARALAREMRKAEKNDVAPELTSIRSDLADIEHLMPQLEATIVDLETTVTGAIHNDGTFHLLSDWEKGIFGRSTAEHVVWRRKDGTDPFTEGSAGPDSEVA